MPREEPLFERVALIGIGLIGSSLAHAIRRECLAGEIVVSTRRAETLKRAEELGLGDRYEASAAEAVKGADLVILSVPVGACGAVAKEIGPHLEKSAILTDVGSTKGSVVRDVAPHLPEGVHFIPGHPIAGTEHSGPDAGFASLFEGRWTILTPLPGADPAAVAKLTTFWTACGSKVDIMDPEHHDRVLAIVSHLPHIIAYNIVGTADDLEAVSKSEVIKYSASGFRDFTRLAASDPTMWRDVCLSNRDAILEMLGRFSEDLAALQRSIRWSDGDALFDLFTRTRAIRRSIIEAGQEVDAPDFGRHPEIQHQKSHDDAG
ncbi:MAG: prephenate/arogenate dehydrogenase family protein [Oricola sp.]